MKFFFTLTGLLLILNAHAQTSFLDPAFGSGGIVITSFSPEYGQITSVVIQPDNKIIAVGSGDTGKILIARYLENGTLDSGFANNGIFLGPQQAAATDVILQPDGKIVAEGIGSYLSEASITVRLNTDGSLDTSFGGTGIVYSNFAFESTDLGNSLIIQSDVKIMILGQDNETWVGLMRLLPDGSFDRSFGDTGVVTTNIPGTPAQLSQMADGRLVTGGSYFYHQMLFATRLLPTGQLDTTFNHTGLAVVNAGDGENFGFSSLLQPDGKIVIGGVGTFGADGEDFTLVRFNSDGTIDRSFGDTGVVNIDFDMDDDQLACITLIRGNKILAVGNAKIGGVKQFAVACINSNGIVDSAFGVNGRITTLAASGSNNGNWAVQQTDNKIILGGYSGSIEPTLIRYSNTDESITELHNGNDVYLSPNPSKGKLSIYGTVSHIASITACDLAGKNIPFQTNINNNQIQTGNIASGLYFFTISFDNRPPITQRIVIQP